MKSCEYKDENGNCKLFGRPKECKMIAHIAATTLSAEAILNNINPLDHVNIALGASAGAYSEFYKGIEQKIKDQEELSPEETHIGREIVQYMDIMEQSDLEDLDKAWKLFVFLAASGRSLEHLIINELLEDGMTVPQMEEIFEKAEKEGVNITETTQRKMAEKIRKSKD